MFILATFFALPLIWMLLFGFVFVALIYDSYTCRHNDDSLAMRIVITLFGIVAISVYIFKHEFNLPALETIATYVAGYVVIGFIYAGVDILLSTFFERNRVKDARSDAHSISDFENRLRANSDIYGLFTYKVLDGNSAQHASVSFDFKKAALARVMTLITCYWPVYAISMLLGGLIEKLIRALHNMWNDVFVKLIRGIMSGA